MSKTNFYMLQKNKNSSFADLSKIIIDAIESEQFFNKETLIPKIKAILYGFKMNMGTSKYNKILNPSESAKMIRQLERMEVEVRYWKGVVQKLQPDESKNHFDKLDILLTDFGFITKQS